MQSPLPQLCIIGTPVHHSLSPLLHSTALQSLGIPWRYEAVEVKPDELREFIAAVRTSGTLGFNVTIPHKETIIPMLDEVDEAALRIGAVNTVVIKNNRLRGYNTDVIGVERSLSGYRVDIQRGAALVIGSGGAARAVAYTLANTIRAERIRFASRNKEKTEKLIQDLKIANAEIVSWEVFSSLERVQDAIIVNTTPIGMLPNVEDSPVPPRFKFNARQIAFDAIYRPVKTKFLADAELQGAMIRNGLPMLLHQAAAAFALWTGKTLPLALVEETLQRALAAQA